MLQIDIFRLLGALSMFFLAVVIALSLILILTKRRRTFVNIAGRTVLALLLVLSIFTLIIYARYKYNIL